MDWHAVLGVRTDATPEEAREAYSRLVKIHHPDHGGGTAQFILIQQAYEDAKASSFANRKTPEPHRPRPDPKPPPVKQPKIRSSPRMKKPYAVMVVLVGLVLILNRLHGSHRHIAGAGTCPRGEPVIAVSNVQILPDTGLDEPGELIMVSGSLTNQTTGVIAVSGIGFYFTQANPLVPPDWTDIMSNMDASGDTTQIPIGATVQWRDKQVVSPHTGWNGAVAASLEFPESASSQTSFEWSWPDEAWGCPGPNVFN